MLEKIISGGQTGVDRAALDVAIENNLSHGGYCPKGRIAEDGKIDDVYDLIELKTKSYVIRTKKNVEESDGTLIFIFANLMGPGTKLTKITTIARNKPLLIIDLSKEIDKNLELVVEWIQDNNIKIVNVAGSRESKIPGIYLKTYQFIYLILDKLGVEINGREIQHSQGKIS